MRGFSTHWLGQSVSFIGSAATGFALSLWLFERTGQAAELSLVALTGAIPSTLINLFFILGFASYFALWRAKAPPEMQGRVFAARRIVIALGGQVGYIMAGPWADGPCRACQRAALWSACSARGWAKARVQELCWCICWGV
jgi:hypothetical protein